VLIIPSSWGSQLDGEIASTPCRISGFLGKKVNVLVNKKRKIGPKSVDCVFLGYSSHSTTFRFIAVKYGVDDMNVGTIF
jgi:hypothetical protein